MRVFVTGGSGFVGGHLLSYLAKCGDEVHAPKVSNFEIREIDSVRGALSTFKPDVIIHLAGIAFVPDCESDFGNALAVNVLGTENVLKAAREICPDAKIVFISSGDLYGKVEPESLPCREIDSPVPANNYSLTKIFAEQLVQRATTVYGQKTVIMRPFNHIGPWQSNRFAVSSFAEQLAIMKRDKCPKPIQVGNLSAKRDFTDVRDIVRGYRLAAVNGEGIYNLCSSVSVSMQEILERLIKISGLNVKIEVDPTRLRTVEIVETRGSNERAKTDLGWEPHISLDQSLEDCLNSQLLQVGS
jgi:GDP-4-dehydro-6-deoxy-D-mannose reductase